MLNMGGYPSGCQYDRAAPWNQQDQPERKFNITCSQSLSKTTDVLTDDYGSTMEKEFDGEAVVPVVEYDTTNTNWAAEYHLNDHYTPIQLIELFQKYLLDEVNGSCTVSKSNEYLNHLISECNNWTEDETEYFEE